MKKRIFLSIAAIAAIAVGVVGMSAFEAHVINVTAKIENALSVPIDEIAFGTVFPQEQLNADLNIGLSESFMDEDRVDDVNYMIRQKPKCALFDNNQIIDYAVLMKVLPKIHGNRAKVETVLYWILVWASDPKKCEEKQKEFQGELGKVRNEFLDVMGKEPEVLLNKVQTTESIKYPKTAEKVARMLFQLYSTGFTSYL